MSVSRRSLNSTSVDAEGIPVVDARSVVSASPPLPVIPREGVMTIQPPSGEDSVIIPLAVADLTDMVWEVVQPAFA